MKPCRSPYRVSLCIGVSLVVLATACTGETPAGVDCDVAGIPTLTIGTTVNGAMEDSDCSVEGDPGDVYRLSLSATTLFGATVASDKYGSQIFIQKNTGVISDNGDVVFSSGKPARANALLPAGEYIVEIQSDGNVKGPYTLTTKALDGTGCPEASGYKTFTLTGFAIAGTIAAGDCVSAVGGIPNDGYFMRLTAGTSYAVTVNSSLPNVHLEVSKDGTVVAGAGIQSTTGKLTINYTPTASDYYRVALVSVTGAPGPYTLTVTP